MKTINNCFKNVFKWNFSQLLKAVLGIFIFAFALNIFIIPMGLYNGGILGLAQLIRTLLIDSLNLNINFDIAGLLNFVINVPLFILAYKSISKTFFSRTLFCVTIQTLFLTFIPTFNEPIITDMLTSVLIGGILAGVGSGMALSAGASTGGTDIIGIALSQRNRNFSVGKFGLAFNVVIYAICGAMSGLATMIYSILFSVFATFMVDRTHEQNICSTAIIFTKKKPNKIVDFVQNELDRGATTWEANGEYKDTKTYITYLVLSKYELQRLERNLPDLDQNAFMVKTDGVGIDGNFKKKL